MAPDIRGVLGISDPETAKTVRANVVERLIASGADPAAARRLAEGSYRRVSDMIENAQRAGTTRRTG